MPSSNLPRIDEIADGIYRIHTPIPPSVVPGGFSFNQYLIVDEEPLLFHTGGRHLFPSISEAIETVLPLERLRWVGCSHFESDECGSMNQLLAAAPRAQPLCGRINAMINADAWDRPPRALAEGESLSIGARTLRWFDTPHLPHGWECGYLFEEKSRTLLCGDLFTQGGGEAPALVNNDILGPSEAFRRQVDYYAHPRNAPEMLARLAAARPKTLACMHGSAWQGDGAALLGDLARELAA